MKLLNKFGRNLRRLRLEVKLTQAELAAKLSIDQRQVSRYESGKNKPSVDILPSLAKVLQVEIEQFFK